MLKKLLLITLAILLIFGACACSNESQKPTDAPDADETEQKETDSETNGNASSDSVLLSGDTRYRIIYPKDANPANARRIYNKLKALDKNAVKVEHSVYDHIIYDSSTVEKPFALALDNDPDVKMFFKIPDRFKIDTPIGTYNPDWAVLWEKNGEQKLYFIIETKGTTSLFNLKTPEQLKIHCGMEHFKALDNGLEMHVATDWNKFKINE